MGNYTIFLKFENPRRGRQARNFSENDPKILDLKSSSEQIIFRKLSLGAPDIDDTGREAKGPSNLTLIFVPQKQKRMFYLCQVSKYCNLLRAYIYKIIKYRNM